MVSMVHEVPVATKASLDLLVREEAREGLETTVLAVQTVTVRYGTKSKEMFLCRVQRCR